VRLGNFIEVANDLFMHIIGAADIRYKTVENYDFENRVYDRVDQRSPSAPNTHEGNSDLMYARLRLGLEARYQKNLALYLLFEHRQIFDGNLIDDRSNSTNPGGTDVFGPPASTENPASTPSATGSTTSSPARRCACALGRTCGMSIRPPWSARR
jgi:hypothetical protein